VPPREPSVIGTQLATWTAAAVAPVATSADPAVTASATRRAAMRIVRSSGEIPRTSTWNREPGRAPVIRSKDSTSRSARTFSFWTS